MARAPRVSLLVAMGAATLVVTGCARRGATPSPLPLPPPSEIAHPVVEPHTPANPWLWSIWAAISSWFYESEHMLEWARQDFAGTCRAAGLDTEGVLVTTFGIHRITFFAPNREVSRSSTAERPVSRPVGAGPRGNIARQEAQG